MSSESLVSRREFLRQAALLSGGLGALTALPDSILRAAAIDPAQGSTVMDAEHVVILMQENRSFDHMFGALRGVRGFDDPRAVTLPDGNPVWLQTDAKGATYAPFRLDIHGTKATWMRALPHSRTDQVAASNGGAYDAWLTAKEAKSWPGMPLTLGHYDRRDIPFYYALADAFTVCDQHFSSTMTCTTPNRLFLWTGTNRDPDDLKKNAVLDNGAACHTRRVDWKTFPERLEEHGVSWKVYQNELALPSGFSGEENAWLANYGDNPLEYFSQYRVECAGPQRAFIEKQVASLEKDIAAVENKPAATAREKLAAAKKKITRDGYRRLLDQTSPEEFAKLPAAARAIHARAFTTNSGDPNQRKLVSLKYSDKGAARDMSAPAGDVLYQFRKDVNEGKLPAVSWLVAPEAFSDHPSSAWFGAWYVSETLDILTKNPEVWKKTVFILTYDENDGYYDHVPPFSPPPSSAALDTRSEFDGRGDPIGLGYRVPMVVASPWSRGGRVCSQVFDHTSVLRFLEVFLERKTGKPVRETNISEWRRIVSGDLTSVFVPEKQSRGDNPVAVARNTFFEGIHKAKFLDLPSGFRALTPPEVAEARKSPSKSSALPRQEPGSRPVCALPYELYVDGALDREKSAFRLTFSAGDKLFGERSAGSPFRVYAPGKYKRSGSDPAGGANWSYCARPGQRTEDAWPLDKFADGRYGLRVAGPDGFFREFAGDAGDLPLEIACAYVTGDSGRPTGDIALKLKHAGTAGEIAVKVADVSYGAAPVTRKLSPGESATLAFDLRKSSGWYDLTLTVAGREHYLRRFAGKAQNGRIGLSDPLIGRKA